jgi:hypothetical protein
MPPAPDIIFNNTLHWLPVHVLQTLPLPTTTHNPPNVPALPHTNPSDNVASFRFDDNTYSYSAQDDDDRNIPALPAISSATSSTSCPPSTRIITFPCPSPINIDICKIYSQNVHGLWCRARDSKGQITQNCKRDTTKLEHLIHWMRVNDIDAWLIQETWLENNNYDTIMGGYHLFQHNSPVGSTGRCHLLKGVAIVLSPRFYLA